MQMKINYYIQHLEQCPRTFSGASMVNLSGVLDRLWQMIRSFVGITRTFRYKFPSLYGFPEMDISLLQVVIVGIILYIAKFFGPYMYLRFCIVFVFSLLVYKHAIPIVTLPRV